MDLKRKKQSSSPLIQSIRPSSLFKSGLPLATALAFNEYIKKVLASSLNKQGLTDTSSTLLPSPLYPALSLALLTDM